VCEKVGSFICTGAMQGTSYLVLHLPSVYAIPALCQYILLPSTTVDLVLLSGDCFSLGVNTASAVNNSKVLIKLHLYRQPKRQLSQHASKCTKTGLRKTLQVQKCSANH